jgi:Na+-transporting methylmalonyl-CoA/oxaloacetate decarboxylase beta subunit
METGQIVHLFHVLIVGTLFLYVGIRRDKIPGFMYPILLGFGVIVVLYHMYKIYLSVAKGKKPYWVNLIHLLLIGPLLLYIGVHKEKTSRKFYEFLLLFGFASVGYHGYYMLKGDS